MQDRFLQCTLRAVIVQRCSRHPQKQREFLPVIEHIRDRLTQTGVRLYFPFHELRTKPGMQLFYYRPAMLLVEVEALLGGQALRPRLIVVAVYLAESFQYEPALLGKTRRHLHEVSPTVRQTVGQQCGEWAGRLRHIPRTVSYN